MRPQSESSAPSAMRPLQTADYLGKRSVHLVQSNSRASYSSLYCSIYDDGIMIPDVGDRSSDGVISFFDRTERDSLSWDMSSMGTISYSDGSVTTPDPLK